MKSVRSGKLLILTGIVAAVAGNICATGVIHAKCVPAPGLKKRHVAGKVVVDVPTGRIGLIVITRLDVGAILKAGHPETVADLRNTQGSVLHAGQRSVV